jgi:hypothetical protein
MPMRLLGVCALFVAAAAAASIGATGATLPSLSGRWDGSGGTEMQLSQSGGTVTWFAHSSDNTSWAHDFTGTLSGTSISGTFRDRPGFAVHNYGAITARVEDACHLLITGLSINGGPMGPGGERFTKAGCTYTAPATPVSIESVSNGCGGAGWASLVKAQNYLGNTSTYRDSNLNPRAKAYTVNFVDACNLHDAGYSGAVVRDKLHGGIVVDFRTWSRKRVDDKFLADMRLLCERQIPARAATALRNCKGRGGNFSFGALSRYNFVRTWGGSFFDADPTQDGTQQTGLRANY